MRLNADIVFDNMSDHFDVRMLGRKETGFHLGRPRFYAGNGQVFEQDTLYVIRADKLPLRSPVRKGVVLVVVGESRQISLYKNRCTVIQVIDDVDIFNVFNLIQDIYNQYEALDDEIMGIVNSTAQIQSLVDVAAPVMGVDMLVLDASFEVLAATEKQPSTSLDLDVLSTFLANAELAMQKREPMPLTILDGSYLSQNIYVDDRYAGSVTFDYASRRRLPSDSLMICYIARAISSALRKLPESAKGDFGDLRRTLMDLVDCISIDQSQRASLERLKGSRRYVCAKMLLSENSTKLPYGYLCAELEAMLPRSIAFAHGSSIVGIIPIDELDAEDDGYVEPLKAALEGFIETVHVMIGVSDLFSDLLRIRLYYEQAQAALVGADFSTQACRCYFFQDYALAKLLLNAIGDLPLDMYYTAGMHRLVEHDREGSISYVDTLQCYLDNSMNVAKTAQCLFIHRSTLLDRLKRIERELDCDLRDPDTRLRVELLLKARQIYEAANN